MSHSSIVLDSATKSHLVPSSSSAITLTASSAVVSPGQYADFYSIVDSGPANEHLNVNPNATKADTRSNCSMTSAISIPNKVT